MKYYRKCKRTGFFEYLYSDMNSVKGWKKCWW